MGSKEILFTLGRCNDLAQFRRGVYILMENNNLCQPRVRERYEHPFRVVAVVVSVVVVGGQNRLPSLEVGPG